jgi:hypothetical protein
MGEAGGRELPNVTYHQGALANNTVDSRLPPMQLAMT